MPESKEGTMNREEMEKEVAKEIGWPPEENQMAGGVVYSLLMARNALVTARLKISELDSALAKRKTELAGKKEFADNTVVLLNEVSISLSKAKAELATLKAEREEERRKAFEAGWTELNNIPIGTIGDNSLESAVAAYLKSLESQ